MPIRAAKRDSKTEILQSAWHYSPRPGGRCPKAAQKRSRNKGWKLYVNAKLEAEL